MLVEKESSNFYEKKYHFLIDNILDVVGELDLNGIFTYVNPYIYDELGYQPDEIIGRQIYEFVHPDDAKKITKALLIRPKSHDLIPEIRLKNVKNQFIWYELKARRLKDYNNQRKILITLKNISKVKVLEEKLEKKDENYQKITNSIPEIQFWNVLTPRKYERVIRTTSEMLKVIIENIPQCVFWKDINFKYLGCNGNYSKFIGVEHPESIIGKTDEDLLLNREKIQHIRESETSVILSGKPVYHTNESWIIKKGENIWLDITRIPLIGIRGVVNGVLVTFEEITDRKIAEENLRNSEKKYKNLSSELETIMDIIPSMIFVKNKSGIYTRVNQIFADYLKLEKKDIVGKSSFDLFPQELATYLKRDDLEVIKNGIPKLNVEKTVMFPIGNISAIISKMPYYNEKDEINGVIGFAIDVSERKELEQRLIKSEERYRELANSLPQIICETDERGNLTFVNNNAYTLFGYTPNDFNKGLTAFQMLIPEDRKRVMEDMKRVLRGKKEEKMRDNGYTALRKDGSTFPVNIYSSPIIYKDSSVGMRSIIIDITDKMKAEQRLKESEKKYKLLSEELELILDHIVGLVFYKDTKNNFIWVNKYIADAHKMKREDLIGKSLFELYPEEVAQTYWDDDLEVINSGKPKLNIEETWQTADGLKWLLTSKIPYIDENGDIKGIIGSSVDITERAIVEQKLIESVAKQRGLLETAVMGIAEYDVEGNSISYINPRLLEILGYTKEDLLVENNPLQIIHPEDRKELIESSEDKYVEFRVFTKDGKLKWLTGTRNNRFNKDGKLVSARLWVQDSTESKEVEEIKSNLLTRFSHEFKTPLISIAGFADLLLTEHKKKLDEKILLFLKRIKDGSARLNMLINSFVESSQLDKAIIQVKLRQENLYDIIKDALDELEGAIHMREHEINLNIGKQLITRLDKEKIHRVVINLLINAINYTPKGGKIAIHSKIEKKSIEISVKDTGIGLDKSELAKLFKPFGKIERYGKGWDIVGGGMGMGLFVSKEIIELHNGRIWVKSEGRNEGTTFNFSIPKRK